MVRNLAHALRAIPLPALRRMLALCMIACLVLGPVGGAMATHHADDIDSVLVLLDGSIDTTAKAPLDHSSLPAGDHDCHGCSAAMPHSPTLAAAMRVPMTVAILSENLVDGRVPGTQFRPPRA